MLGRTWFTPDISFPKGGTPKTTHYKKDLAARRPDDPSPRLCERCQDWDVPEFAAGQGSKAHRNLPLGTIIRSAAECLVCEAVAEAVEARRRECEWLRDASAGSVFVVVQGPFFLDAGLAGDQEGRLHRTVGEAEVRLFLELTISVVSRGDEKTGEVVPSPFFVTPQFRMRYSGKDTLRLQVVEEWEVDRFEVSTLKSWIEDCERRHCYGKRGARPCLPDHNSISELPKGFRVIDVKSMRIVQPDKAVRFVALSYMWEATEGTGHTQLVSSNTEDLGVEGSLNAIKLPQIITDTISLCRDLGKDYLWVDRLCIIQDDERSKPEQIDGMDRIYQSATFAIMAALDDRNGKGLPGYREHRRRPRASLWGPPRNRNSRRGIDPNGVQDIVDPSLWNRRGWTFQERLFTKRRFFITEYQVLFECCRGQAAEELTWSLCPVKEPPAVIDNEDDDKGDTEKNEEEDDDDNDAQPPHLQEFMIDSVETEQKVHRPGTGFYRKPSYYKPSTIKLQDRVTLADYCHWVEDYTSRQLSHPADILNAFAGVANAVRKAMKTDTMFGLPAACLPQALMWSHVGASARRDEARWIPSWSWAGWEGTAGYRWIHGEARLVESKLVRVATLVSFHYHDPAVTGRLRAVGVRERWLGLEMRKLNIHGPDKLPRLQRRMSGGKINILEETDRLYEEMWQMCPHSPWESLARGELDERAVKVAKDFPGCLVFNTTVASLRIGRDRRYSQTRERRAFEDAEILDVMGRRVGYLDKMDIHWIAGRKGRGGRRRPLDFIVISASMEEISSEKNEWAFVEGQFHELWRFNVMLVERLPYEPFVARRVGVGFVRVSQWKECNPRWETVVLC
ncbi:hypothetical protein CkaCkLH20_10331 [Colletotrichum karsti]|uniref:Heterokaryon incompatibility domain-containing protein n=1 Tax=Colletotrichum karsti TaxID=1095194 RepID=A0A9P6HXA1_9PEZI|nr:uncharacterized protein CkaCkLH20_10331 [Colletotrichum karsti]KAF9872239.1 hypothetical protein CkaCkLH20_10331 [Colletotrichum karsti]